jgi:hypothetical protein
MIREEPKVRTWGKTEFTPHAPDICGKNVPHPEIQMIALSNAYRSPAQNR